MLDEFSKLPELAQKSLARISKALNGVVPFDTKEWQFAIASLPEGKDESKLIDEVRQWAGNSKNCVYYLQCANPEVDLSEVGRRFADAKAHERNGRAYARLNTKSACFYVGSSRTVAKRLTEHLGYGAASTYALQLVHWARPLNLQLVFVCAKYPPATAYEVVQELEDALWEKREPMFGRKGRK